MSSPTIPSKSRAAAHLALGLSRAPSLSAEEVRRAMLVEIFGASGPDLTTERGSVEAFAEVSEAIRWAQTGLVEPRGAVSVLEDLRSEVMQMASLPDLSGVRLESLYVDKQPVALPSDNPRVIAKKLGNQLQPEVRKALGERAQTFTAQPLPIHLYDLAVDVGGGGRLHIRNDWENSGAGGGIPVPFTPADASNPAKLAEMACEAFVRRYPEFAEPLPPKYDWSNTSTYGVETLGQTLAIKGPDGKKRSVDLPFEPQRVQFHYDEAGKRLTLIAAGISRNEEGSRRVTFAIVDPKKGEIASIQKFSSIPRRVFEVRGYGMKDGSPAEVRREVPVRIDFQLMRNSNPGELSQPFMDLTVRPDLSGTEDLVNPESDSHVSVHRLQMPESTR